MNLASLSTAQLRRHLSLQEKIVVLKAELVRVESEVNKLLGSESRTTPVRAKKPVKVAAKVKTKVVPVPASKPNKAGKAALVPASGGKSTLKEAILELLSLAGEAGASVKDIATKLGITTGHAHVWFATTGKKSGKLHKVKPGIYRLKKGK